MKCFKVKNSFFHLKTYRVNLKKIIYDEKSKKINFLFYKNKSFSGIRQENIFHKTTNLPI